MYWIFDFYLLKFLFQVFVVCLAYQLNSSMNTTQVLAIIISH